MNTETKNNIETISGGLLDNLINLSLDKLVCSYENEKGLIKILVSDDKFQKIAYNFEPNTEHIFKNIPFYIGEKGKEINPFLLINKGQQSGIYLLLNDNDKNFFLNDKRPSYSITILEDRIKKLYINLFKTQIKQCFNYSSS